MLWNVYPGQYSPENQLLGSLLLELRLELGLRQVDVADRLGAYQSYVSRYENGEKSFKFAEVYFICTRGLEIPFQRFIRVYDERLMKTLAGIAAEKEKRRAARS